MSRYTDIDLLLNNYQTICSGVACMDCPFNDEGCQLEKMLLESPTADVVPVVHGNWEEKEVVNLKIDDWQTARCSVCGKWHTTPYLYYYSNYNFSSNYSYCPHCGAKIDVLGVSE